jgi:hypothetical protein
LSAVNLFPIGPRLEFDKGTVWAPSFSTLPLSLFYGVRKSLIILMFPSSVLSSKLSPSLMTSHWLVPTRPIFYPLLMACCEELLKCPAHRHNERQGWSQH